MGDKILVGPYTKGLRDDLFPFNIDNDSFPTLINAYQWRGRVKRKRGTAPLCRLYRQIDTSTIQTNGSGSFSGNILSALESGSSVVFNSISVGSDNFTDPASNGILVGSSGGSGTINYSTGALTLTGAPISTNIEFEYYPTLPVMGLEDANLEPTSFLQVIGFDTKYSYNLSTNPPFSVTDITFYNNPISGSYSGYVSKTSPTPFVWNGEDYQQFGSVNYEGALWVINGITIPFNSSDTTIGLQIAHIISVTVITTTTVTLNITAHGLVVGDFVFINEVATTTGINFQTGYVTTVTDANNVIVTFPDATIATNGTGGIAQYLTSSSAKPGFDCIRFYSNLSPSQGTATTSGWVNFMPPLSSAIFGIADLPDAQYYLAGASIVLPFKDRLMFIGPVVQTSTGKPIYLQDTVIYSQNGTPYYTASFSGAISPSTTYYPILTPLNQSSTVNSWWEDQTGLGGYITAGFQSAINTASANEDVIIMGFGDRQARFAYTGNDILPFQFFVINSELGSGSTFSAINLDRGILSMGSRGFIITSQIESRRIDLDIPNHIFQIDLLNQGSHRICAARDYINEWVYFSYPSNAAAQNDLNPVYNTQTLQYNYRDQTWGLFNETYTTYGLFRQTTGWTWATIGEQFPTWEDWNEPWDSSSTTQLQPIVIAGNTQGFVVQRGIGTAEAPSLTIQAMSGATITSANHCLNAGDYITISGTITSVPINLNGFVFSVTSVTNDTFGLSPNPFPASYTYLGGGTITRFCVPFIASKAFPVAWEYGRKTRLGPQQYLLSATPSGQVTLYIFLSQNYADSISSQNAYNFSPVTPALDPLNSGLIYSTVLYTCPESTNLGLTAANTNLQMNATPATGTSPQQQIWHRVNTSLIGDTVQVGITLNDSQMRDPTLTNQVAEIELSAMVLDVSPSSLLA